MFTSMLLPFVLQCLAPSVWGHSVKRADPKYNSRVTREIHHLDPWDWKNNLAVPELDFRDTDLVFEDIVKSISILDTELKYDPKTQKFILVTEAEGSDSTKQKNNENDLLLLTPKIYKKLKNILMKFEKEEKEGKFGVRDIKNFQTGRFKIHKNVRG